MKYPLLLIIAFLFASSSLAQSRTNEAMQRQIKALGSERSIEIEYDAGSNTSKIKAVSENFSSDETRRAGARAMNFAAGIIYAGQAIDHAAEPMLLSFWVLSSRPRFGDDHTLIVFAGNETLEMGDARYVERSRDGMEYLNFNLTREQLKKIAVETNVKILLGRNEFNFTKSQLKLLTDLYLITEFAR